MENTDNTVTPKQQRSIASKQKILQTATKVFAEKGLNGARIDEISQESGINKQRIYAYFGSKEELYRQTLISVYAQAVENERLLKLQEKDIPDMTKIILESFFRFHRENPIFWRLLAWENLNGGKSLRDKDWQDLQSNYICHLRELYELGQNKKIFRDNIDFSTYLITIFSVSFFYFSNRLTISHLLNLELGNQDIQNSFTQQVHQLLYSGITKIDPIKKHPKPVNLPQ